MANVNGNENKESMQSRRDVGDAVCQQAIIVDDNTEMEGILAAMRSLIKKMMEAMKKQPNVNKTIKEGIPALVEHLERLQECQRPFKKVPNLPRCLATPAAQRVAESGSCTSSPMSPALQLAPKSGQKRAAVSPPVPPATEVLKKIRNDGTPEKEWTVVEKKRIKKKQKKKKDRTTSKSGSKDAKNAPQVADNSVLRAKTGSTKRKTGPPKRDAIVLKPAAGHTYADILSAVRKEVKPDTCGVEIKEVRRTRAGDVLLELRKTTTEARAALSEALRVAIGERSSVRELVPGASLEIKDLDCCSPKEEVEAALRQSLPGYAGSLRVSLTRPNTREQVTAIVAIDEAEANILLQTARVKIGWVNCRIRRRVEVPRCFKCLGYGHRSQACGGPDRSKACYKCGTKDIRRLVARQA